MSLFGPVNSCGCSVVVDNCLQFLPQVSLKAHATILSSAARTTLTQTFLNPSEFALKEVSYKFPLYDGVSVVGFKCQVGKRLLHSEVKSKDQANAEYKQAVERFESAAIMDHNLTQGDVFKTRVGNVPAHEKVTIDITFIGELKQDAQTDGVRYTLPNSIAPRYGPSPLFSNEPENAPNFRAELTGISITTDVLLEKSSIIREIQSPSHSPKVSLGRTSVTRSDSRAFEPSQASATLRLGNDTKPLLEKDFVLVVKADGLDNPRAMLETHSTIPGQRALMATLVPKFNLPAIKPEIVFVIDRSGSMGGNIPTLRAALRVFLKSLPLGVCFNICSFGSFFNFLWPSSQVYDRSSLEHALSFVDSVEANYGGTEIYPAVAGTIQQRLPNKDLEVLLLTDGDITRQNELFDLLRRESSDHTTRCFTLGIGTGTSHSLIEGTARAGQGFSQAILRDEELDRCVVRMLKGALTPHIYDYKIKVDYENTVEQDFEIVSDSELSMPEKEVESRDSTVTPAPAEPISLFSEDFQEPETVGIDSTKGDDDLPNISAPKDLQAPYNTPPLYPFIRSTAYLLLDPESADKVPKSLTFSATSKQGPLCLRIPITDIGNGETIHQLAARKAVVELEELHGWLSDAKDDSGNPFEQLHQGTKDRIAARECQALGIKYQVTGKHCSFVALEDKSTESENEPTEEEEEEAVDEAAPVQWTISPGGFGTYNVTSPCRSSFRTAIMSLEYELTNSIAAQQQQARFRQLHMLQKSQRLPPQQINMMAAQAPTSSRRSMTTARLASAGPLNQQQLCQPRASYLAASSSGSLFGNAASPPPPPPPASQPSFGAPSASASPFGFGQPAPNEQPTSLFGARAASASSFGQSAPNQKSSSLFGSAPQNQVPVAANAAVPSGAMFGSNSQNQSAFGSASASQGGLFSANAQTQQACMSAAPAPAGGLSGGHFAIPQARRLHQPEAANSHTGGLFGPSAATSQSGGLFGGQNQQAGGNPFSSAASNAQAGTLFGGQPAPQGGFGSSAAPAFGSAATPAQSSALFGGRPPNQQAQSALFGSTAQSPPDSPLQDPKSKVHALVGAQTFEGSWIWEERLFEIMGYDMEEIRDKIGDMLQNDGRRDTLNEREANVVATFIAMDWLKREHSDLKDIWDLVYVKASEWAQNELAEVGSELLFAYGADVWTSLI